MPLDGSRFPKVKFHPGVSRDPMSFRAASFLFGPATTLLFIYPGAIIRHFLVFPQRFQDDDDGSAVDSSFEADRRDLFFLKGSIKWSLPYSGVA